MLLASNGLIINSGGDWDLLGFWEWQWKEKPELLDRLSQITVVLGCFILELIAQTFSNQRDVGGGSGIKHCCLSEC